MQQVIISKVISNNTELLSNTDNVFEIYEFSIIKVNSTDEIIDNIYKEYISFKETIIKKEEDYIIEEYMDNNPELKEACLEDVELHHKIFGLGYYSKDDISLLVKNSNKFTIRLVRCSCNCHSFNSNKKCYCMCNTEHYCTKLYEKSDDYFIIIDIIDNQDIKIKSSELEKRLCSCQGDTLMADQLIKTLL